MAVSGSLSKMVLASFSNEAYTQRVAEMTVYLNPESYTHRYSVEYNDNQAQGSSGKSPQFNRLLADQISFTLVFDGTGVVPPPLPSARGGVEVDAQIDAFRNLALRYDGEIHSPNFVQVRWGSLVFNGRLTELNLVYSLFKPDGRPLRARADVTFLRYQSPKEIAKTEDKRSADLTRVVTVQGGDTLPLLCHRIYGSSVYYAEVARRNGLTGFRNLSPGESLVFPPLGEAA